MSDYPYDIYKLIEKYTPPKYIDRGPSIDSSITLSKKGYSIVKSLVREPTLDDAVRNIVYGTVKLPDHFSDLTVDVNRIDDNINRIDDNINDNYLRNIWNEGNNQLDSF